jgi:hypothetical protein
MINNQIKFPIIINSSNCDFTQFGGFDIINNKILTLDPYLIVDHKIFKKIILDSLQDNTKKIIKLHIELIAKIINKNIYDVNNKIYLYKNQNNNDMINLYYDKENNVFYPWRLLTKSNPTIEQNILKLIDGVKMDLSGNDTISFYYTIMQYLNLNEMDVDEFKKNIIDQINININDKNEWKSIIDKYINEFRKIKNIDILLQTYFIGNYNHPIYKYLNNLNSKFSETINILKDHKDIYDIYNKLSSDIKDKINIINYINNNNIIINKINKKFNGILIYSNNLMNSYNKLKKNI